MKFDSYQRFLRSEIYKECALLELQGKPLPYEDAQISTVTSTANADGNGNKETSTTGISTFSGGGSPSKQEPPVKPTKRKSLFPLHWRTLKNAINNSNNSNNNSNTNNNNNKTHFHSTSSVDSSNSPPTQKESFKRTHWRKLTYSIPLRLRSKSLDEKLDQHNNNQHLNNNHINNNTNEILSGSGVSDPHRHHHSHSEAVHSSGCRIKSSLCDSRNSLITNAGVCSGGGSIGGTGAGGGSDSIDLSDPINNNVFSPSPESITNGRESGGCISRVASLSNESGPSSVDQSPVSNNNVASAFNHNCNRDSCHFLRIVFPDRSQTIVPSTPDETIEMLLRRLLEKRGLNYMAYDVFVTGGRDDRALDPVTNINTLGCTELRVEQRALFQMDFPDGEVVGIKTRPNRRSGDVFRSILLNYGYKPEHVLVVEAESGELVDPNALVSAIDGRNILVSYRKDLEEWGVDPSRRTIPAALNNQLINSNTNINSKQQPQQLQKQQEQQSLTTITNNDLEESSMSLYDNTNPGDDTQSDAFYSSIQQQQQHHQSSPSHISSGSRTGITNQSSPYKIVSLSVLQQIRLQQRQQEQHQLPAAQHSPRQQTSPLQHHHQIASQSGQAQSSQTISSASSNVAYGLVKSNKNRTTESVVSNEIDHDSVISTTVSETTTRASYKASHLRDLQNHQNFKSCLEGTTIGVGTISVNLNESNRIHNMTCNIGHDVGNMLSGEVIDDVHKYVPLSMPLSMATESKSRNNIFQFQSVDQLSIASTFANSPPPPLPPKQQIKMTQQHPQLHKTTASTIPLPSSNVARLPYNHSSVSTNFIYTHQPHHHHPHHPSLFNHHHHYQFSANNNNQLQSSYRHQHNHLDNGSKSVSGSCSIGGEGAKCKIGGSRENVSKSNGASSSIESESQGVLTNDASYV